MIDWRPKRPPGASSRSTVREVLGPEALADGLDHLDADHGVVLADGVAVVADVDGDPVGDAGLLGADAGELRLLHRERQRRHACAALRGADRGLAPPGADLEDAAAGAHAREVEDPVDLAVLGVGQRTRAGRAGSNQAAEYIIDSSRKSAEQVVRQVVVPVHVLARDRRVGGDLLVRLAAVVDAAQVAQRTRHELLDVVGEAAQHADEVVGVPVADHPALAEADEALAAEAREEGLRADEAELGALRVALDRPVRPHEVQREADDGRAHQGAGHRHAEPVLARVLQARPHTLCGPRDDAAGLGGARGR